MNRLLDDLRESVDHEDHVNLGGRRYVVGFDLDAMEVQRRARTGLADLNDHGALHALWALPIGLKTSSVGMRPEHRERLESMPAGAVDLTHETVERLAVAPLLVRYLVAERQVAATALDALGDKWWAPIEVAVARRSASTTAVHRATRSRTGLIDPTGLRAAPVTSTIGRPTPLLWLQAELVYGAWLASRPVPTAEAGVRP